MSNNNIPKMMPFLIQCTERVGPPQRSQLESLLGAILSQYVPENSFLTRLSEDQAEAVRQLPFIKSVLPVSAEEKLEKELTNTLTRAEGLRQTIRIMAMLFEGADTQVAVEFVKECGGRVSGFDGQWLEIEIDAALVVELAGNPEVQYIEEAKDYELLNDRAGEITRAPSLWVKSFTGKGQIIGIADTGLDTGVPETMHQDFKNRTVAIYSLGRSEDASDFHGHGTHVAGSAFGGGTASEGRYRGMAPDAKFVFQSVMDKDGGLAGIPGDLGMLLDQAYMAGARVYNISWGMYVKGQYNYAAAQIDRYIREHDDLAVAVAAGNTGRTGEIYSPAVAKNVIAVGASENNRKEKGSNSDNPYEMTFFSSRGPAADGRRKPDVVAPGTWVLSAKSSLAPNSNFWAVENQFYAYNGGTSMAAPMVAGMLALVREFFTQSHGINPSFALLKAALINGAVQLPGYPENTQGWGRLNPPDPILDPSVGLFFVNQETKLATGEKKDYEFMVTNTENQLKVTLVWTDYPGTVNASPSLVNDLDLMVVSPYGQIHTLNDHLNNIEHIVIPSPETGIYKITVSGYNVPMGYQDYALFVSGGQAPQPDIIPPAVSITNPEDGSTVSGTISISADVNDNVAVSRVEFYVDENVIGIKSSPPYTIDVDTSTLANKTCTLTAKAYDNAGNWGQDTISFTVNNPTQAPEVKITWPQNGVTVKGIIKLRVNVSSTHPLSNITFFANNTPLAIYDYTKANAPINNISAYTKVDTTLYPNGHLILRVQACDNFNSCGNMSVNVTVNNP